MFSKFLFSLLALAAFVAAYANPGSCFGSCNVHDPAVIRRPDGTYFRFSTGNRIQIASASCLAGPWKIEGSALPNGSSIDLAGNMDLWAPDISLVDNTYYLYYSVGTFGSQSSAIGVVTSTTMDVDTWMDHGSTGVTSSSGDFYNAIDSNLVQLHRGGYQLNFGSSWGDLHQVPMVSPLASNDSATQIAYDPAGTHAEEGSFMIYRKGYHYIFFSWGSCCGYDINPPPLGQEYKIYVCRSRSSTRGFVSVILGVGCGRFG